MTKPAARQIRSVEAEAPEPPFDLPVNNSGLALPRLRVLAADGTQYTIQAYNPDLILFEDTAAKHRWKGPADAPFRWLTFLAWAASRRTGIIDQSVTWESFSTTTLQVENLENETANPTRPGVDPG